MSFHVLHALSTTLGGEQKPSVLSRTMKFVEEQFLCRLRREPANVSSDESRHVRGIRFLCEELIRLYCFCYIAVSWAFI